MDHPESNPPAAGPIPFLDLLGVRLLEMAEGRGRLELILDHKHLRSLGIAHGGVVATLLDSVMGMAAGTLAPAGHYVVTVQLNVNYLRPAWEGERLRASAEVRHAGRSTAVARGEVVTEAGTPVALGSATFMHVPHADPARTQIERREDTPPADPGAGTPP